MSITKQQHDGFLQTDLTFRVRRLYYYYEAIAGFRGETPTTDTNAAHNKKSKALEGNCKLKSKKL
jgi:hypothetical protein